MEFTIEESHAVAFVECALQRMARENPPAGNSPWWEAYAREHVWAQAPWAALERGKCAECGSDGKPTKAEIAALGPMRDKRAWCLAREALARKYALVVVHIDPPRHDIGFDGCHHHLACLRVLCGPCYRSSPFFSPPEYIAPEPRQKLKNWDHV